MDDLDLNSLSSDCLVIVPTRTLANDLKERHAKYQVAQGKTAWTSPNILLWDDFIAQLWQLNEFKGNLLSPLQASIIWTRIIERSAREEEDLYLLNVPQTVKAVQRSWQLLNDWQITEEKLRDDHGQDSQQFANWLQQYTNYLDKNGFVDRPLALSRLLDFDIRCHYQKIVRYGEIAATAAQEKLISKFTDQGIKDELIWPLSSQQEISSERYACVTDELRQVFERARKLLETHAKERNEKPIRINVVVPDLHQRYREIDALAQAACYPNHSPREMQEQHSVYRLTRGLKLAQIPQIQVALLLCELWSRPASLNEILFLFRNVHLSELASHFDALHVFSDWLQQRRYERIHIPALAEMYRRVPEHDAALLTLFQDIQRLSQDISQALSLQREKQGYATATIEQWLAWTSQWLLLWGWRVAERSQEPSSYENQLAQRWRELLDNMASLSEVSNAMGSARWLTCLRSLARDTIFQPKSADAPVVISGLVDVLGRPADYLFLSGLNDEYPARWRADAFVERRLLQQAGHPRSSTLGELAYQQEFLSRLISSAKHVFLSFAETDTQGADLAHTPTTLLADREWPKTLDSVVGGQLKDFKMEVFGSYQGVALKPDESIKGGTRIFEDQSRCPFKAFAAHRLKLRIDEEHQLGLDGVEKGNVLHVLMESLWGEIKTQAALFGLGEEELNNKISQHIDELIRSNKIGLNEDKLRLLSHERFRLQQILFDWFDLEKKRPEAFTVVARERRGQGSVGGLEFSFVLDRLDQLDDGRYVIIDYKSGISNRNHWLGERLMSPQLPLYLQAEQDEGVNFAGMAIAQLKSRQQDFIELAQESVFKTATGKRTQGVEENWQQGQKQWPQQCRDLAEQFTSGDARVDPLEPSVCRYCQFTSLCRIESLVKGVEHDQ